VLGAVPQDAHILSQEIFGPVAPVVAYDDTEEAIALADKTEYGLVPYVYTHDLRAGLRVAERIDSGMVGLNRPVVSDPAAPFGGTKQSGLGREGGHEGMLEFTENRYVAVVEDSTLTWRATPDLSIFHSSFKLKPMLGDLAQ
jgi:succinate-semialdehyde dehydrogenase/glutarate-semialdehyde dehydrogenase